MSGVRGISQFFNTPGARFTYTLMCDCCFKKKRNCTIHVAKTEALINFAVICAFDFAYADCCFFHAAAHVVSNHIACPFKPRALTFTATTLELNIVANFKSSSRVCFPQIVALSFCQTFFRRRTIIICFGCDVVG